MPESSRVSRRQWSEAFKRQVVAEASAPGVSVTSVARRHDRIYPVKHGMVMYDALYAWCRDCQTETHVWPQKM